MRTPRKGFEPLRGESLTSCLITDLQAGAVVHLATSARQMRQPGFEPGFEAWQASVITTTLPAQKSSMRLCARIYIKVISATVGHFALV